MLCKSSRKVLLGVLQVAFMFNEWYKPKSTLQFPVGGSQEMANALARSVRRRGGRVHTAAHVEEITLNDKGVATGVRVRGGLSVSARKAVVTNATLWDAQKLLPISARSSQETESGYGRASHGSFGKVPDSFPKEIAKIPPIRSFMHLHVGFDATGIDPEMHHIVVNSWEGGIDTEQNVVLISIASVADPTLAPKGKHVLHAYTPAVRYSALLCTAPWNSGLFHHAYELVWVFGVEKSEQLLGCMDQVESSIECMHADRAI
jgi:phytoene dehydrogenase-like protein